MERPATDHPRIVRVDGAQPDPAVIADAAAVLRRGGVVGFPTETFYGLAAAALNPRAVARIFRVKDRSASKPLLVLVDSVDMVATIAADIPQAARTLMQRHWPGPLTLVLPAQPHVPPEVTAGTGTVGVRISGHPVARALVTALGAPVTAPSANREGHAPPTTAADVVAALGDAVDLVIDGGSTPGGAPSTILDLTSDPPRVVREGPVRPCA
jgi:L-threonylcarbamoyladenylate synthase